MICDNTSYGNSRTKPNFKDVLRRLWLGAKHIKNTIKRLLRFGFQESDKRLRLN